MSNTERDKIVAQKAMAFKSNFDQFQKFMSIHYAEDMRAWDSELITYFDKMNQMSKEIDFVMTHY